MAPPIEIETLKTKRRGTKSAFTRSANSLSDLIIANRPLPEVHDCFVVLLEKFGKVEKAHEAYSELLDDDQYDQEEAWMNDIQVQLNIITSKVNDYKQKMAPQTPETPDNPVPNPSQPALSKALNMAKIPIPKFSGRIEDYLVFKKDWADIVESRYGKSTDTLYVLRNSLENSKKWIQGIVDYQAAWQKLEEVFGNTRDISDALIGDLEKTRPINENDLSKFIEFYHKIKKAETVMTQLNCIGDLDNSTTLGVIEKKLSTADKLKWAEHQLKNSITPNIGSFLSWMWLNIQIHKVAGADIRSSVMGTNKKSVNAASLGSGEEKSDNLSVNNQLGIQISPSPSNTGNSKPYCWLCKIVDHKIEQCPKFQTLSADERLASVREHRACYFCLRKHGPPCRMKKVKCNRPIPNAEGQNCPYSHHILLHGADFMRRTGTAVSQVNGNSKTGDSNYTSSNRERLLPMLPAVVNGEKIKCLLDSGSQLTLIRQSLIDKLGIQGQEIELELVSVGESIQKLKTNIYEIELNNLAGNESRKIEVIAMPKICNNSAVIDKRDLCKLFNIPEELIDISCGPIDILIGVDNIEFFAGNIERKGDFCLRETIFGPVLFGSAEREQPVGNVISNILITQIREPIDISRFWETEQMGVTLNWCCQQRPRGQKVKTALEKKEEQQIRESASQIETQWVIPLPWKQDPHQLPNNYYQAYTKLCSLERRLLKNPKMASTYNNQVEQLVEAGSAKKLTEVEVKNYEGPVHYMSHHAVIRPEKPTHPCRMVFNQAECYKGHVVNEYLSKCGDHLNDLFSVLIRWRDFEYAFVGDVRKMYHQILVTPGPDIHTHRFLWRNYELNRTPDIYAKVVLTFGDVSSPALANIAMDMTAEKFDAKYPEAVTTIKECRYMDDIADSVKTVENVEKRTSEIDKILETGHFNIKSWIKNNSRAPAEGENKIEKVLGVIWNTRIDKIAIHMTIPREITVPLTKRIVTSILAAIYDIFGFGAPVIIKGKIALQHLWRIKLEWDSPIPPELQKTWLKWIDEVRLLGNIKIDRSLTPQNAGSSADLIIFCDASDAAFGCVAYLRWELENKEVDIRFAMAKSRVSPLRNISLPRKELQAIVMGSRICNTIRIESRLELKNIHIFTDSMIALSWIQNDSRLYKTFVSGRIGEILTKTQREYHGYCPSKENVADDVSRGIPVNQLDNRWLNGPEFMKQPKSTWPVRFADNLQQNEHVEHDEERLSFKVKVALQNEPHLESQLKHISTLPRLIRVVAYVLRFIDNLKSKRKKREINTGPLVAGEVGNAKLCLVKLAQVEIKCQNYNIKYSSLSPFVDDDGVVRVGGRLENAEVSYNQKHPPLLPKKHFISQLVVENKHKYGHPGVAATTAKVRSEFWIIGVNRISKTVVSRCIFCRELRAKVEEPYMANLPSVRLNPSPPFFHSACDLFGPMNIKIRRNTTAKVWGVLFTCLATRSVYCDLTMDYSAMEFLQTFRRFLSIRGRPKTVLSDNGSQLVTAKREIEAWCANREIEWKFATPVAPHQNGCAESLIRSIKKALKLVIGEHVLSGFELQTVLFEAANLVNERPIGISLSDPNDGSYISPNGVLLGRASDNIPHGPFAETKNPRHRVEFCQKIIDDWWKRWYRDVFPTLTPRKKWNVQNRNVCIGDIVLLNETNPVRGNWVRARVIKVFPGPDGIVRNVELKTSNGVYQRPVQRLCVLLPVEEQ